MANTLKAQCSVSRTLDLIGDQWTMLVLRELFWGAHRFEEFRANLGIARNILSDRLRKLTEAQIIERHATSAGGRRAEYHLSRRGRELLPVILSLLQWGDRWLADESGPPVEIRVRASGELLPPIRPRGADGQALRGSELVLQPGPGANDEMRARLAAIRQQAPMAAPALQSRK